MFKCHGCQTFDAADLIEKLQHPTYLFNTDLEAYRLLHSCPDMAVGKYSPYLAHFYANRPR